MIEYMYVYIAEHNVESYVIQFYEYFYDYLCFLLYNIINVCNTIIIGKILYHLITDVVYIS